MKTIRLTIPSEPAYVTTLRLVAASAARSMDMDVEEVDDLRVCVSEAVNYLLPYNEEISVVFAMEEDRLQVSIRASNREEEGEESHLHHLILEALMDEVEEEENTIVLVKHRSLHR